MPKHYDEWGRKLVIPGDQSLARAIMGEERGPNLDPGDPDALPADRNKSGLVHDLYLDVDQKFGRLLAWNHAYDFGFTDDELRAAEEQLYQRSGELGWSRELAPKNVNLVVVPYTGDFKRDFTIWFDLLSYAFPGGVSCEAQFRAAIEAGESCDYHYPGRALKIEAIYLEKKRQNMFIADVDDPAGAGMGVLAAAADGMKWLQRLDHRLVWLPAVRAMIGTGITRCEHVMTLCLDDESHALHLDSIPTSQMRTRGTVFPYSR